MIQYLETFAIRYNIFIALVIQYLTIFAVRYNIVVSLLVLCLNNILTILPTSCLPSCRDNPLNNYTTSIHFKNLKRYYKILTIFDTIIYKFTILLGCAMNLYEA